MGKLHASKTVNGISGSKMQARLEKILILRAKHEENIENIHVKLQNGNSKTGRIVNTVSLIPIVDCANCNQCKTKCYDIRNDCLYPSVQNDRARNSAIHRLDRERYWREIEEQVIAYRVYALRINVGGDVDFMDMAMIREMAERNRKTEFLFFTKNYADANLFLEKYPELPENMHMIFSRWEGMECDNRNNMPEAHILWKDGSTTAPHYGAYYCQGDCTDCLISGEGCWKLKKGEHVVFNAH